MNASKRTSRPAEFVRAEIYQRLPIMSQHLSHRAFFTRQYKGYDAKCYFSTVIPFADWGERSCFENVLDKEGRRRLQAARQSHRRESISSTKPLYPLIAQFSLECSLFLLQRDQKSLLFAFVLGGEALLII